MNLASIPVKKKAIILEKNIEEIPLKLVELGFVPNHTVEVLQKSIFNDPIYIKVNNSFLCIRKSLAMKIMVEII